MGGRMALCAVQGGPALPPPSLRCFQDSAAVSAQEDTSRRSPAVRQSLWVGLGGGVCLQLPPQAQELLFKDLVPSALLERRLLPNQRAHFVFLELQGCCY